jgi:hypothetical protein
MTPEERAALIDEVARGLESQPYGYATTEASRRLHRLWREGTRVIGSSDFAVVLHFGDHNVRAAHLEFFGAGPGGLLADLRAHLRQRCVAQPAGAVEVLEVRQGDSLDQGRLIRVDEDSNCPWGHGWYRRGADGEWEPWRSHWDTSG